MSSEGHNNPPVILELTHKEAEFLLENAESNVEMGIEILAAVQAGSMSVEAVQAAVAFIESFRPLREKIKTALK